MAPPTLNARAFLANGATQDFLRSTRIYLANGARYAEFMKLINLFSKYHIDTVALCELASPFFAGNKQLWGWFTELLGVDIQQTVEEEQQERASKRKGSVMSEDADDDKETKKQKQKKQKKQKGAA